MEERLRELMSGVIEALIDEEWLAVDIYHSILNISNTDLIDIGNGIFDFAVKYVWTQKAEDNENEKLMKLGMCSYRRAGKPALMPDGKYPTGIIAEAYLAQELIEEVA